MGADGGADSLAFAQFRSDRLLVLAECGFQHFAGTLLLRFDFCSKSFASVKRLFMEMAPLSRMFRPPVGSAMLMLLFVVRTTSKPALSSASVTFLTRLSSPDEARASKPRVIASAASCFVLGNEDGVTSARRFPPVRSGRAAPVARSPRSATHRCADGLPGRSTAGDAAVSRFRVRYQKIQFSPCRCSTHSTLYWSLSSRASEPARKCHQLFTLAGR